MSRSQWDHLNHKWNDVSDIISLINVLISVRSSQNNVSTVRSKMTLQMQNSSSWCGASVVTGKRPCSSPSWSRSRTLFLENCHSWGGDYIQQSCASRRTNKLLSLSSSSSRSWFSMTTRRRIRSTPCLMRKLLPSTWRDKTSSDESKTRLSFVQICK